MKTLQNIFLVSHQKLNEKAANLRKQMNIPYEKPLQERKAVDCRIPKIVFLISPLDGILPLIKSAI